MRFSSIYVWVYVPDEASKQIIRGALHASVSRSFVLHAHRIRSPQAVYVLAHWHTLRPRRALPFDIEAAGRRRYRFGSGASLLLLSATLIATASAMIISLTM